MSIYAAPLPCHMPPIYAFRGRFFAAIFRCFFIFITIMAGSSPYFHAEIAPPYCSLLRALPARACQKSRMPIWFCQVLSSSHHYSSHYLLSCHSPFGLPHYWATSHWPAHCPIRLPPSFSETDLWCAKCARAYATFTCQEERCPPPAGKCVCGVCAGSAK